MKLIIITSIILSGFWQCAFARVIKIGLHDKLRMIYISANRDYQVSEDISSDGEWSESKTIINAKSKTKTLIRSSPATIEKIVVASPPTITSSSRPLKFSCQASSDNKILITQFDSRKVFKGDYKNIKIKPTRQKTSKPCLFMLKTSRFDTNPYNIFRGDIIIIPHKNYFTVINAIGIEDYLRSVVASEVSKTWPAEALKAQAVAARTYTLSHLGRRKNLGYDLKSGVEDQMYLGYKKESKSINNAIKATLGEFLVDKQGLVVDAYYSSHSGTYSSYPEYVWGLAPKHYLQAVKEFSTETKAWDLKLSINDLAEKLKDLKFQKISAITILKRSPEGRVNSVLISGSKNNLLAHMTLTGEEFRHHLGLRSTNFDYNWVIEETIITPAAPLTPVKKQNLFRRLFSFKSNETKPNPPLKKIVQNKLIISGKGYGHGIGLSQYDAKFLASQGKSYKYILGYYYQGAKIIKIKG